MLTNKKITILLRFYVKEKTQFKIEGHNLSFNEVIIDFETFLMFQLTNNS
jgi:hypothetical protein